MEQHALFGAVPVQTRRAPPPQVHPYPGASPALAAVLGQITSLPRSDQAALLRAFRLADKPARPARIAAHTYRAYDDFQPAFTAARMAAIEAHGARWWLDPDVTCKARLPVAWTICKIFGGTARSPRDVNMPKARFWPGGTLPVGPDYAEHAPLAVDGDVRTASERLGARRAAAMRAMFPTMATAMYGFELEPSPAGEMDTSKLETV